MEFITRIQPGRMDRQADQEVVPRPVGRDRCRSDQAVEMFKETTQAKDMIGEPRLRESAPTVKLHEVTFDRVGEPVPGLEAGVADPAWLITLSNVPMAPIGAGFPGSTSEAPRKELLCVAVSIYDLKLDAWTDFAKSWCHYAP